MKAHAAVVCGLLQALGAHYVHTALCVFHVLLQMLYELQNQIRSTNNSLQQVRANVLNQKKKKRRAELTQSEVTGLGDSTVTYKAVGRM